MKVEIKTGPTKIKELKKNKNVMLEQKSAMEGKREVECQK